MPTTIRDRRWGMLLALALASGCATPPPAVAPQPAASTEAPAAAAPSADRPELPPLLQGIGLDAEQVAQVLRINADLERKGETFVSAVTELGRSVAGSARQCKGETPFLEADAARVVRVAEEMRGPVLDTVQKVHRLLTPAQRRTVSDRLVEGDDWAKRERRNASRTRELGPALDLSATQVMSMLVKAGVLWTQFADRAEPWRVRYRTAITDFARDDFDARGEAVASVPVVALTVEFVQTGLRMLIPVLDPKQCEALGRLVDEKVDEQAARWAERVAAHARAVEHP